MKEFMVRSPLRSSPTGAIMHREAQNQTIFLNRGWGEENMKWIKLEK